MSGSSPQYLVISPVRNEASNIEKTLASVVAQTIKPLRWMIVDDGSSDDTAVIVEKYAKQHPWMQLIRLRDRGYYDLMSGGEVKAFLRAYESIKAEAFDYLAKLDGDISFEPDYYERLLAEFEKNAKLGIAGGCCWHFERGRLVKEPNDRLHPRGATRVYRRACWDHIGGVQDKLSWDAIDAYKARMLGWETRDFDHIRTIHHVKTWTKGGVLHGRVRSGRLQYLMATHPLLFWLKCLRALFSWPPLLGACAMAYGYLKAGLAGEARVPDPELQRYIREEQLRRLRLRR
jgi:biofilm PGA synthesis N-glycosyltransferase PgaC